MLTTRYRIVGHSGDAYDVLEYGAGGAIFAYRGYVYGNTIRLYPKHSLCRGVTRSKKTLSLLEVTK